MKSFTFKKHDARLRFLELPGQGTPLLILHGMGGAASFEYPELARLGRLAACHVILIDMLGFGYSDKPADFGYRISDHADVIAACVTSMGLGPFNLFGHSMGGAVALETAAIFGDQVDHLILAEANLDKADGKFSVDLAAVSEEAYVGHLHDETIAAAERSGNADWAATMQASAPRAVYLGAKSLVAGSAQSWRDILYQHPAKKSFIFGERSLPKPDLAVLPQHGIKTFVVPNAGHFMGLENPVGLADCIEKALGLSGTENQ